MDSANAPPTPESILTLAGSELARAVYRTANTLLASSADAEEVTLDVLVALRKKLGELEPAALEAWLQTLPGWLDHAAVSKAKARARKPKHHSGTLAELAALAEQLGASEGSSADEVAARLVKEVLSYLPRRHRFVFLLESGLGHTPEAIAELTGLEPDNVARTRAGVEHKLREYATHHPMPKAMLDGMAAGVEDNPLRHYIEFFGHPDEPTRARIHRRFEAWLSDTPRHELSADDHSFHDHSFSGASFRAKDVLAGLPDGVITESDTAQELEPEPEPEPEPMQYRQASAGGWVFGVVASLAVLALAGVQWQLNQRIGELAEQLEKVDASHGSASNKGPVLLEPGAFVELAHGSRVEPSLDATIELLRNDETGAEFRLSAGSIGLLVKPAEGVETLVHDGRYDIIASSSRFRVIHTSSVPEVEVFDGKVHVRGGLLGTAGVDVSASNYSLANVLRARGDVPVAELMPYAAVDPKDLASLATDEVYGRALALRSSDEAAAKKLLREIVERGHDDWVSELAFEQLRTLVDPDERLPLQVAYAERFPDGQFAEAFAAIACQALEQDEATAACWTEFGLTYPNSLFGP